MLGEDEGKVRSSRHPSEEGAALAHPGFAGGEREAWGPFAETCEPVNR